MNLCKLKDFIIGGIKKFIKWLPKAGRYIVSAAKKLGIKNALEIAGSAVTLIAGVKKLAKHNDKKNKIENATDLGLKLGNEEQKDEVASSHKKQIKKFAKSAFKKDSMDKMEYKAQKRDIEDKLNRARTSNLNNWIYEGKVTEEDLNGNYAKFLRECCGKTMEEIIEILYNTKNSDLNYTSEEKFDCIEDNNLFGQEYYDLDTECPTEAELEDVRQKILTNREISEYELYIAHRYMPVLLKNYRLQRKRVKRTRKASGSAPLRNPKLAY